MKIGFIGTGKMGGAILKGIVSSNFCAPENILISEPNAELAQKISKDLKVNIATSSKELVKNSDVIIICTKPFIIKDVLADIRSEITKDKLLISIAAGISTESIETIVGDIPVVRVMPNTPAFLGCGMSALSKGKFASDEQLSLGQEIFSKVGKAITIDESLLNAVTGVSGSGPAFFYLVIEALAKGGEKLGISPEIAMELACQTAIGSAEMIMQTGKTPELLRKEVTTPGGTTEVGLNVLADNNVFEIFEKTVIATAKKAEELGK